MADYTTNDVYSKLDDIYDYLTSYNFPSIIDDMYAWFPEDIPYNMNQELGYDSTTLHDDLQGVNDKLDKLIELLTPEENDPVIGEDGKPIETDPYIIKLNAIKEDTSHLSASVDDYGLQFQHWIKSDGQYISFLLFVVVFAFCLKRIENAAAYIRR